ncbi:hypothetical protein AOLI_G00179500 [Acnodon oligacanthus]
MFHATYLQPGPSESRCVERGRPPQHMRTLAAALKSHFDENGITATAQSPMALVMWMHQVLVLELLNSTKSKNSNTETFTAALMLKLDHKELFRMRHRPRVRLRAASEAAAGGLSAWSENILINNNPRYVKASLDSPWIEVLPSSSKETPPQPKPSKSDENEDKDTDDELSLKKDKLQRLLQKLDSRMPDHDKHSSQQSQSESMETPTSVGPGESGWEKKAPADRQTDDSSETDCSTDDRLNLYMHHCWRRVFQSISVPIIITSVFIIELLRLCLRVW